MCQSTVTKHRGECFRYASVYHECIGAVCQKVQKVSKNSDHWLAWELRLPDMIVAPIADVIDSAIAALAWPHQMLLNLNPELAKASGGTRTITKTHTLYRLWCRRRKTAM